MSFVAGESTNPSQMFQTASTSQQDDDSDLLHDIELQRLKVYREYMIMSRLIYYHRILTEGNVISS